MKRRAISFITVLALCLSLCPTRVLAAGWVPDALDSADTPMVIASGVPSTKYTVIKNTTIKGPYDITQPMVFDTDGYSYTASDASTLRVTDTGRLHLTTGTIESKKEAGVEVQTGGFLCVEAAGMTVIGKTYGLDISAGAAAQLSGGTFTGQQAAIRTGDGNYSALLKFGCAYFDAGGNPIPPAAVAGKTTVVVKECTAHSYRYTPSPDSPTHDGVCVYCGKTITSVKCTFNFDENGQAICDDCGHTIKIDIAIDESSLVYDGTPRPDSVSVTVTLDGETISEETNIYYWDYTPRINAGETITVTVSVADVIYEGTFMDEGTFTEFFTVAQDTPEITWKNAEQLVFAYRADKAGLLSDIKNALLSNLEIDIKAAGEDLRGDIQFSYKVKEDSDAGFTDGLPTNAGTYEIKASLPETQNYHAASSGPISLTINKVDPVIEAPVAVKPVYNGAAQKLVTNGAAPDGAEIQFAVSENGPWSKDIPTGINAGDYVVWYRVIDEANNYNVVKATSINSVKIKRKEITPTVELEYYTCVYDGGDKEPKVTVRDEDDYWTVLPSTEYEVTYEDNQDVGTATVTVTDQRKGNYAITTVVTSFKITEADQDVLTVTGRPNTVIYGDVFTLGTSGGSGNGTVTWKITEGDGIAEIGEKSGQVTVKGVGTVTVLATKSEGDSANHKEATAQWTFTAGKRPVTATVTAQNKTYDGKATAKVNAVVEQGVVSGDKIEITVTGTFSDANAGTGKTVTVDTAGAVITVNGTQITNNNSAANEKYIVTIPGTVTADIDKVVSRIVTPPTPAARTYSGAPQELLCKGAVPNNQKNIQVEYALNKDGPYSAEIPKATDAGRYEVWYRARESTNYTAIPAAMLEVTIAPKRVTVRNSDVTLTPATYVYDGAEKKPAVTVKDGNDVIPASEYTVTYSNNVNVGTNATVTITDNAGGNYEVSGSATFQITEGKAVLTGTPKANSLTYNGNPQDLVSVGSASGGHLVYALEKINEDGTKAALVYEETVPKGEDAKTYTVYYKVVGDGNHTGIDTPSIVYVTIQPKTVSSPVITLDLNTKTADFTGTYNGSPQKPIVTSVADGGVTIGSGEYTVTYSNNVNAGTATVHIIDNNGGNYIVNGSKTFEITKATAKFADSEKPTAIANLTYNAKAQPLITAGVPEGGTAVYSLGDKNGPYSIAIPTGTDRGGYEVWAKVLGDANHKDSDPIEIKDVKIGVNNVASPTVELSSTSFRYNGSEQKPTVTVKDDKGNVIPVNEYTVTYGGDTNGDTINVGTYKIKIASKKDGNYLFTAECTVAILAADQTPLTITGKPGTVYYGDTIQLSAAGGSGSGSVKWTVTAGTDYAEIVEATGKLTIKGTGSVTVKAARASDTGNYAPVEDTWTFYAYPKPVAAVVTAASKVYDGDTNATLSVTVPVTGIAITVKTGFQGTFDDENVGTNKTVTWTNLSENVEVKGDEKSYYDITYPDTTTASITPASTDLTGITVTGNNSTYRGRPQPLVSVEGAVTGGSLAYSLTGIDYSLTIPTGKDAGDYTVWYKVLADSNHTDSEVNSVVVTIGKAKPTLESAPTASSITAGRLLKESQLTGGKAMFDGVEVPGTFTWTRTEESETPLEESGVHGVTFTPADRVNFEPVTTEVTVEVKAQDPDSEPAPGTTTTPDTSETTPAPTNPGTESTSIQTSVQDGAANAVLNTAAGDQLVDEAIVNQSGNVVIKPEITGDVTKTEVSIPASAVSRLRNETDAALTVSTPVADVSIPNGALDTLSSAGGTVSVITERMENTVMLTLTANGEEIGGIPGGVTLTVPVEDAGPGTVAVLVYEDGTRETVRKSVMEGDMLRIPLNGSVTVEIVDNSKEFADVPAESWAAGAVAFASAREMFSGTSETTFSPELTMSRATLATVLYNLEGRPDQSLTTHFSDVSSGTWYTAGVSWAAANGVTGGYGNGQFGPNDNITREQLVVMLWRYAGSPAADEQTLSFTDADQASDYAMEALYWATENGILNGYGNGRLDPCGLATRAQAAQMLKNFIENI